VKKKTGRDVAHWFDLFPWATLGRREAPSDFRRKCKEQEGRNALFKKRPRFSLIAVGASGAEKEKLKFTIEALSMQSYPDWQLIVVGIGEKPPFGLGKMTDPRVVWVQTSSGSPSALKNQGVAKATGDWIGFMDPGDVLSPAALHQFAFSLQTEDPDVVYTNEAFVTLNARGSKIETFLSKPAFSWLDLIHSNYIGRFWMARRSVFDELVGFNESSGEFHEHEFLLRAAETLRSFKHEPFFYYYRPGPPRSLRGEKIETDLVPIIENHLKIKRLPAKVSPSPMGVHIVPSLSAANHLISGVVCFRNKSEWTIKCAQQFALAAGNVPVELFLVNNQSSVSELKAIKKAIPKIKIPIKIIDYDLPFNFGNMHNVVVRDHARGDFIFLLNNDVFLAGECGLDELAAWAQFDWVGTVGMLLRFPNGNVQHGGFCALFGGEARMARVGHVQNDPYVLETREVFGNTFAACLVKRSTFESVGGLRELDYPNGFGDVAFNFACLRQSLKNIYVGHVGGVHLESASRGVSYEYWEECGIESEYPDILQQMLRKDLGFNRVPGADFPIKSLLRQAVTQRLFEKLPWLLPWKPRLKKVLNWSPGGLTS
jgi:GT2 family glycosyltransferase